MIIDDEKQHYLGVINLSSLYRRIKLKHDGDCYSLNCLRSFKAENKLKKNENASKNHKYCCLFESLLEKIDTCECNTEDSLTANINKHTACGNSLFTHCSCDNKRNKHDYYRGEDCVKSLWKEFIKHAAEIINSKKKMIQNENK